MRIKGTYNELFINTDYIDPVIDDWYGYIYSDGSFDGLEEVNYSIGYATDTAKYVNVRMYNKDIVDFVVVTSHPSGRCGITKFDVLYQDDNTIFTYVNLERTNPNDKAYFLFSNAGEDRTAYVLYVDELSYPTNARNNKTTRMYSPKSNIGDRRRKVVFITNDVNDTFNGKYMEYADADDYVLYVTDDGKNIAFDFCKNRGKRQAMFAIKSKELIQRFGKDFIKRDFLSKTFITGSQNHIRFFHETYGELFEISFQKPNHIEINFDNGEIIKEDDGQIAVCYVKKKPGEIKKKL